MMQVWLGFIEDVCEEGRGRMDAVEAVCAGGQTLRWKGFTHMNNCMDMNLKERTGTSSRGLHVKSIPSTGYGGKLDMMDDGDAEVLRAEH